MAPRGPVPYTISDLTISGGANATPNALGQRLVVEAGHVRFNQVAAPTTQPTMTAGSGGSIAAGTYRYGITFVSASGETELGPTSGTVVVSANGTVSLSGIQTSTNPNVTARRVYRSKIASPNDLFLVGAISDNTTSTYVDNKADGSLAAARYTYTGNSTAGNTYFGSTLVSRITPSETSVGYSSLPVGTGFGNAAFGNRSMMGNTSGYYSSGFGENALGTNTTGIANSAFGAWALLGGAGGLTGLNNSALGFQAGMNTTSGAGNLFLGAASGSALSTGTGNLFAGYNAGNYPANNQAATDDYCGYIGYQAGRSVVSGTKLTNAWAIGRNAQVGASNTMVVGGASTDAMDMILTGNLTLGLNADRQNYVRIKSPVSTHYLDIGSYSDGGYYIAQTTPSGAVKSFSITGSGYMTLGSTYGSVWLSSAANMGMYFDTGEKFYFRDRDNGNSTSATIDSANGDITTIGKLNGIRFHGKLTAAPSSGFAEGDQYHNTTDHKTYIYNGTSWMAAF